MDVPPFGVAFDRILRFNGRPEHRPFVLMGSDGLDGRSCFNAGFWLRSEGPVCAFPAHASRLISRCCTAMARSIDAIIEPIAWTVNEFILIHSWLGKTRYDVMGRWSLTALTDSAPTI